MTDAAWTLYAEEMHNVDGWFFEADVSLFTKLLACQGAEGVRGDMLEIGTYQGKSAILMGYGLRDEEELVICDLFDAVMDHADMSSTPRQQYSGLNQQQFLANWDRFHARRPVLEVCESSELDLGERALRFIHVDGCHSYGCVAKDISLAVAHTAERGVIAIDDYRGVETPGVAAAVWQAVGNGVLFPFAATYMKIYACASAADRSYWLERLRECADICAFPDFDLPSYRSVSAAQLEHSIAEP
ncbi:class I SAM-dependent methyltransferase [Mycobacterium sp. SMC-2]|uniref:class I SAM-dependent methyltransferase n=1 Tax=Mycobacterium sp. SMC-2 TaxID=2857058 RepID=UPI0021B46805|nr:class I SAM-dependent methyltransferase [Mycobacterium sp. SMC-2]UXA08460.1 class I SAM-dependent methyltransferase [Mycobacterium sp. SMC-2]